MFEFLKKIMNNQKSIYSANENKYLHRILNTYINEEPKSQEDEIFFGCGCFWGAEKCFWKLPGVVTTSVGYAGGEKINPTYYEVCSGLTGHSEVVRVIWDKRKIDISDLLKMFWECHNPTQGNRQGNDRGSQYRSAIYTYNQNDMELAIASSQSYQISLKEKGLGLITTEIKNKQKFFYAEDYHQQYLAKPSSRPYCSAMPTQVELKDFPGSNYKLGKKVWNNFNWEISHCVLRSDNEPIVL